MQGPLVFVCSFLVLVVRCYVDRGILKCLLLLLGLALAEDEERACANQNDDNNDRADDCRLVPDAERDLDLRRLARDEGEHVGLRDYGALRVDRQALGK